MEHTEMSGYFWSLGTFSALNTKSSMKAPRVRQMGGYLKKAIPSLREQLSRGQSIKRQVTAFVLFLC